jgi:formylglycine-generating enzyme required for sulfatase activity
MKISATFVTGWAVLVWTVWGTNLQAAAKVSFEKDIKIILESTCLSCHGPKKPKGDLDLTTRALALKGGENGTTLVPGNPEKSPLYTSTILPRDNDSAMPPKGDPLTKRQTDLLKQWIQEGAEWPETVTLAAVPRVNFVRDIQPILEASCVSCHKEGHAKGDLRLDAREPAMTSGKSGPSIVPGDAAKSATYTSTIEPPDSDFIMPPPNKGKPLPKEQTDLLRDWINQGAYWPDGLVLQQKRVEVAGGGPSPELVSQIHWRIVTNLAMNLTAEMKPYTETIPGPKVTFDMVPIPAGHFLLGSAESEPGHKPDESPQRPVAIEAFWMGKCEVTWNEFELFMYPEDEKQRSKLANNGQAYVDPLCDAVTRPSKPYVEMSFGMGKDGYPAISMTQHAANKYCQWLSAKTGHFYRLPTEAEWEYASRAGTTTPYFFGSDPAQLGDYAWYGKNSNWKYQKVGRKKANPWGLYDIYGNVVEWCLDQYDPNFYKTLDPTLTIEPWNVATKPYPHVVRGGSWDDDDPAMLRSAARRGSDASWKAQDPQLPKSVWYHTDAQWLGFRVIRPLKVPPPEALSKYWNSGVEKD